MKEKIKQLIGMKWVRFFLPVLIFLFAFTFEYLFDKVAGDGDGVITFPVFVLVRTILNKLLFFWLIFNIFSIGFNLGRKATIYNLLFVAVVLYGIEFYLYKNDVFLKGPFDSGHYEGNYIKYSNFLEPPPGYKSNNQLTWGYQTRQNKYGFRDKVAVYPKPKNVFRIMSLGDSFTWGAGLDWREMYTHRLDSLLKKEFSTDNIEVINCALAGSPTIRERDILRHFKDSIRPDLIMVGFCINDPQPKSEDYSLEKEKFVKRWGNLLTSIQQNFSDLRMNYIGDVFIKFIYQFQYQTGKFPDFEQALGRVYDKKSKEWNLFEQALADIKNISDSLKCPPPVAGVFTQIGAFNCATNISEQEKNALPVRKGWLAQVGETFKRRGFNTIEFVPVFEEEVRQKRLNGNELMVSPLDGHPSAKMNRVFAREFFNTIVPVIKLKMDSLQQLEN